MAELHHYQFPTRGSSGVLLGLSAPRLAVIATAGVVFVVAMASPTVASVVTGGGIIAGLVAAATVRVGGRMIIDWLPVWTAYGWAAATRNNEFYATPDLQERDLPDGMLDLPGGLFGLELHAYTARSAATVANPTPVGYGVVRDTFRGRLVAVAELSGGDFLFLDPDRQQARIAAWGGVLDHVAQSMPELSRLQLVHTVTPAATAALHRHHADRGGRGTAATAASYRDVIDTAGFASQQHRTLLAVALDLRAARAAIRQAGGGTAVAVEVLLDRAARIEDALQAAGLDVAGWLPARTIAQILRVAFDPASATVLDPAGEVNDGAGVDPAAAGPTGMTDSWSVLRHDSGWSTTLQVIRPPTRPVTGDFLQHLQVGVPATRRLSILYVPTPAATAERRAQTQQVSNRSEQTLRARWGFGTSARQHRELDDAARREQDLVDGRTVYRIVWLVTVTAPDPAALEVAVGQVEAAGRRCGLELRRLAGTQRQTFGFTLPLCRGAQ